MSQDSRDFQVATFEPMEYCFHRAERIDMEFHGEAKGNPSIPKREFYRYLDRMHLGLWAVNYGSKKEPMLCRSTQRPLGFY